MFTIVVEWRALSCIEICVLSNLSICTVRVVKFAQWYDVCALHDPFMYYC